MAGPAAVVHALVGRVRALPRAALRRHRGRLLVAARLLWFWDRLLHGAEGRREAGRRPVRRGVTMLPSEYVDRNCFIGSSNTKRRELGMRYEIGVDNICWGNDFPHPEGTWPNTREWLAKTFHDIPIDETRQMLGLDQRRGLRLRHRRARCPRRQSIGPTPADLGQVERRRPTGAPARRAVGAAQGGRPPLAHRSRLRAAAVIRDRPGQSTRYEVIDSEPSA